LFRSRLFQVLALLLASLLAHASGFPKLATVHVGVNPISAQGGDVNGDGKNDLVVVNYGNNFGQGAVHGTLSVLLGKGDGTFQPPQITPLVSDPTVLILADFDGDHHFDALVGGSFRGENFLEFRHGNGDGTFAPSKVFSAPFGLGINPTAPLAAADFNGDGKLDLISFVTDVNGLQMVILLGNGDGSFGMPRTTVISSLAFGVSDYVAVADFDNDGKIDVAFTFNDGLSVNLGNGDGTFRALSFFSEPGINLERLVPLDFNADGRLDLVIKGLFGTLRVYLGNGDGTFRFSQAFSTDSVIGFLAAADVSGDGRPDVIVGDSTHVTIFVNNDLLPPKPLRYSLGIASGSIKSSLVLEDLNKDGKLDLIAVGGFKPGVAVVAMGIGEGELNAPRMFRTALSISSLAIADFNGDGRSDVVTLNTGNPGGAIFVTKGLGTDLLGSYHKVDLTGFQFASCCLALADFNNDGKLDVLFANSLPAFPQDATLSVLLGNGDLTLQPPIEYSLPRGGLLPVVGDFNRDGTPDVAVAFSNGVQILLGNGDGTFRAGITVPGNVERIAIADFNRDGKLDLVTGQLLNVMLGNGDGTFRQVSNSSSAELGPIIAADINADGLPDIVTVDRNGLSVYLGNGDGTFQAGLSTTFKVGGSALVAADFNRDGKMDVAVIQNLGSSAALPVPVATVFYGRGDGTFRAPVPILAGGTVAALSVADMDRNGTPDLIVTNGSSLITVLLNQP